MIKYMDSTMIPYSLYAFCDSLSAFHTNRPEPPLETNPT